MPAQLARPATGGPFPAGGRRGLDQAGDSRGVVDRGPRVHRSALQDCAEARGRSRAADAEPGRVLGVRAADAPESWPTSRRSSGAAATAPTVCFHPSLLPRYRGGSAIPWQLIRGETTGVTVFWPDAGIDTGPILLQREARVDRTTRPARSTTRRSSRSACRRCSTRWTLVAAGRAPREPQDESQATYDPLLSDAHAAIDWRPSATRARPDPRLRPAARRAHRSGAARGYGCSSRAGWTAPGRRRAPCSRSTPRGSSSRPADGAVRCARARGDGPKAAAAEVAAALGIAPGARLGAGAGQ